MQALSKAKGKGTSPPSQYTDGGNQCHALCGCDVGFADHLYGFGPNVNSGVPVELPKTAANSLPSDQENLDGDPDG